LITSTVTSKNTITDHDIITTIQTRKIIKRRIYIDGQEVILEDTVEEPETKDILHSTSDDIINNWENLLQGVNDKNQIKDITEHKNNSLNDNSTTKELKTPTMIKKMICDDKEKQEKIIIEKTKIEEPSVIDINEEKDKKKDIDEQKDNSFEINPPSDFEDNMNKNQLLNDNLNSTKQTDNTPSFLRKLVKGLKMSTHKNINTNKDNIENIENDTNLKSSINTFLNIEREHETMNKRTLSNEHLDNKEKVPKENIDIDIKQNTTSEISNVDQTSDALKTPTLTNRKSNLEISQTKMPKINILNVQIPPIDVIAPSTQIKSSKETVNIDITKPQYSKNETKGKITEIKLTKTNKSTEMDAVNIDNKNNKPIDNKSEPILHLDTKPTDDSNTISISENDLNEHKLPVLQKK